MNSIKQNPKNALVNLRGRDDRTDTPEALPMLRNHGYRLGCVRMPWLCGSIAS